MTDVTTNVQGLANTIVRAMPEMDATEQRVALSLYRELAKGTPVSLEHLGGRVGLPPERVGTLLDQWPGIYYDEQRRVMGFWGIALRDMPHRMRVADRALYAWCAWDGLFIPPLLQQEAQVESTCPVTGQTVRLTVGPDGVRDVSPPDAVVSFLTPKAEFDADVVMTFCHFVLFFASPQAGATWVEQHPDTFLLSVEEAFEVGRLVNVERFGRAAMEGEPAHA